MFAGLFLLFIGVLMVGGTLYGVRQGKVMTPLRSAHLHEQIWALRGQHGFWFYALFWLCFGSFVLYHAVRLLNAA